MANPTNTDKKLVFLIESGEMIRRIIDPEGITGSCRCERIFHTSPKFGSGSMMITLRFDTGEALMISCQYDPDGLTVKGLRMPDGNKKFIEIPSIQEKSLVQAIKDLSGIPARLKSSLVSTPKRTAKSAENPSKTIMTLFSLERKALFAGIETLSKEESGESRFEDYSAKYTYASDGTVSGVELAAKAPLEEGKILLVTEVNVFGLGKKKVILERNLGMGRGFVAECKKVTDGKTAASIKVAFDLDEHLKTFYTKQRRKKKDIGRPVAGTKSKA